MSSIWRRISKYVDLETGEALTEEEYNKLYYKVRTHKKTTTIEKRNIKITYYTHECRKKPQNGELF